MADEFRNSYWLLAGAVGLIVGVGVTSVVFLNRSTPPIEQPTAVFADDTFADAKEEAYRLASDEKSCEAKEQWQEILRAASGNELLRHTAAEAERNIAFLEERCTPTEPLVSEAHVPEPPQEEKPAPILAEDLVKYYPQGRKIQSVALLHIEGRGTNRRWGIRGDAVFQYVYRVPVETTVVLNEDNVVRFRQKFGVVAQMMAVSKEELQLDPPDDSLLDELLLAVDLAGRRNPYYVAIRVGAGLVSKIALVADPDLRTSLTWLHKHLKAAGVDISGSSNVTLISQVEKLSGAELELDYVNHIGVTTIRTSGVPVFTESELQRLAYNSSLLMDYFIFPSADKEVGDKWTVRTQDIGAILSLGYDTEITGEVTVSRGMDSKTEAGEDIIVLAVEGGTIQAESWANGGDQSFRATVASGTAYYSLDDRYVREARLVVDASSLWASRHHLLFETERVRDVTAEARYEAVAVE